MESRPAKKARALEVADQTVTREDFRRNPSDAFRKIAGGGRLVITDARGMPVAVLSTPTQRIQTVDG